MDRKPPAKTSSGGLYAVPERGMFYRDNNALLASGFYYEERKFMGANVFEGIFEFSGDSERTRKWVMLNIEVALSLKESKYFPVLLQSIQYLILERQYLKAINLYLFVEEKLERIQQLDREGKGIGEYAKVRHLLGDGLNDGFVFGIIITLTTITLANDILHHRIPADTYPEVIENLMSAWGKLSGIRST